MDPISVIDLRLSIGDLPFTLYISSMRTMC